MKSRRPNIHLESPNKKIQIHSGMKRRLSWRKCGITTLQSNVQIKILSQDKDTVRSFMNLFLINVAEYHIIRFTHWERSMWTQEHTSRLSVWGIVLPWFRRLAIIIWPLVKVTKSFQGPIFTASSSSALKSRMVESQCPLWNLRGNEDSRRPFEHFIHIFPESWY